MTVVDSPYTLIYITTWRPFTMETWIAATGVRAFRVNAMRVLAAAVCSITAFIDV